MGWNYGAALSFRRAVFSPRDGRIVFNHVRRGDRAAVKISRDLVPDTDTHDLTGAYQMTSTGPVRHQVFELNALDFAIGGGRPALNFAASDSSAVSFRCRMRLYSTSVQQIRATPSLSNSSQSP